MATMVTVSSKGQIVLPAHIREQLDLRQGDRLHVDVDASGRVSLSPLPNLRDLIATIASYARDVPAVTDVDEYYQQHREQRS